MSRANTTPEGQLSWYSFKNDSGEAIPPHSAIELTEDYEIEGQSTRLLKAKKPADDGSGVFAITGPAATKTDGFGRCTTSDFAWITVDGTPSVGTEIGPKYDEWDAHEDGDALAWKTASAVSDGKVRVIALAGEGSPCPDESPCKKELCGDINDVPVLGASDDLSFILGIDDNDCMVVAPVGTCDPGPDPEGSDGQYDTENSSDTNGDTTVSLSDAGKMYTADHDGPNNYTLPGLGGGGGGGASAASTHAGKYFRIVNATDNVTTIQASTAGEIATVGVDAGDSTTLSGIGAAALVVAVDTPLGVKWMVIPTGTPGLPNVTGGAAVNIRSLGCKTLEEDSNFDNGPLITTALRDGHEALYVPGAGFGIKTTVRFHDTSIAGEGGVLFGAGISQGLGHPQYDNPARTDDDLLNRTGWNVSRLTWTGADGGTVVEAIGSFATIRDLLIQGSVAHHTFGPRAGVGFNVMPKSAAGKAYLPHIAISNCTIGMRANDTQPTSVTPNQACDHWHVGHYVCSECDIAYQVCNSQSNTHRIWSLEIRNCKDIGIDFTYKPGQKTGGMLECENFNIGSGELDTVLKIREPGTATNKFRIGTLRIDAQSDNTTWLDASGTCYVVFNRIIDNGGYDVTPNFTNAKVRVTGAVNVTLRDSELFNNIFAPTVGSTTKPNILLDRCHYNGSDITNTIVELAGNDIGYFRWRDCAKFLGEPITDGSASGVIVP